jgi:hypothetical protein
MRISHRSNTISSQSGLPRAVILIILGVVVVLVVVIPIRAMMRSGSDSNSEFRVDDRFDAYYRDQGGREIFGDPVYEAFIEVDTGKVVQYFENARLELDSDLSGGMDVKTSSLGMMLGGWEVPLTFTGEMAGCRFFHETGHHVCHAFLAYYDSHGGPDVFGYPISEFKIEEDRMVQYFQWFRLDWYPDEEDQTVRPGPLGELHFSMVEPTTTVPDLEQAPDVEGISVVSSVEKASTKTSGEQTVFLLVKDLDQNPIEGAAATLIAHFPSGDRMIVMPLTDVEGRSKVTFAFNDQPPGNNVSLEITVVYRGVVKHTRESFMIYLPSLEESE